MYANLDRDRTRELVSADEQTNCSHTRQTASVSVQDRCGGRWRRFAIVGGFRNFGGTPRLDDAFTIVEADGVTARREVFARVRGFTAGGAVGVAKLVRLDPRRDGCSAPRTLFA